jgi:copper resistance protein D
MARGQAVAGIDVDEISINPLIVVRDIHFATSVIVAGIVFFDLIIAAAVLRSDARLPATESSFRNRMRTILWISLSLSVASALVWLILLSARIAGKPCDEVIADGTIWIVLLQTRFGLAWAIRILLGVLLAACSLPRPAVNTRAAIWQSVAATLLAGGYLGTLAFAGHGEEGLGFERNIHLAADFMHLLAAGLWLGGLIPLAVLLSYLRRFREQQWSEVACNAAGRFSALGMLAVGILVLSGIVNISFLVAGTQALTGTEYGRLLMVKLALFVAMFCVAAINRQYLLPRICGKAGDDQSSPAVQTLVRSTLVEIALGLAIIAIVGVLGITAPATDMPIHTH